jgi:methylenetetrahydrofolate reductase (NADPH)
MEFPGDIAGRLRDVADDTDEVRRIGVEVATELCDRLLREGAPGLHFITLNRSTSTREVWRNLRVGVHAAA